MFDGVRFYGLPNAFIGTVLAGAVLPAALLPARGGLLLVLAAGLLAGLPPLGANLGGGATLFAAAGLWWVGRTRERPGVQGAALAGGIAVLGLAAILLASRYLPGAPTHVTRVVQGGGRALPEVAADRLATTFGQVAAAPAAAIPLLGLPAVLWLAARKPDPVGPALRAVGRRWDRAVMVLAGSGIVAFLANDTGVAAAAPVFLYALTAVAYPAYLGAEGRAAGRPGPPQ
jgi:hypothetical protein